MSTLFRHLPAVDKLLSTLCQHSEFMELPRALLRDLTNEFLDLCREEIRSGAIANEQQLDFNLLVSRVTAYVRKSARPHFRRVLNGTGVVIHTNLGRSLLSESAVAAVADACRNYSNLEFNLADGKRGSRYSHVEEILCKITGAEAALVVNNNAAAVVIVLDTLAKGKEAIVSRGQLIEIGGSFRIPDVMAKSGAVLVEIGATNRTHLHDYERAITENTGMLLKVHTSNYRIVGFHKEVELDELCELGNRHDIPVYEDLGSGNFFDLDPYGLKFEPTVQEVVAAGADVVTFSGDKVLGGPQAGIIVGKKRYIDAIKKNPLNRALRIDKMTLAALEATMKLYLDAEKARTDVPTIRMITESRQSLEGRALELARHLEQTLGEMLSVGTVESVSRVGGGSFPERDLPTHLVTLLPRDESFSVQQLRDALLDTNPPLVGRTEQNAFCLDPRTLRTDEYELVGSALKQALESALG